MSEPLDFSHDMDRPKPTDWAFVLLWFIAGIALLTAGFTINFDLNYVHGLVRRENLGLVVVVSGILLLLLSRVVAHTLSNQPVLRFESWIRWFAGLCAGVAFATTIVT